MIRSFSNSVLPTAHLRRQHQLRWAIALVGLVGVASTCRIARSAAPAGYELFWADEFNGTALDESAWWYRADEKQQSIQLPENVSVSSGSLKLSLTPLAEPINGFDAAGAGVISQERFRYGYYETRSKLGDGVNDDNDGEVDEGWWHAFWAMAAVGNPDGVVTTTFPAIRRTEIDAYENGSNDLTRFTQHVLPWNANGQIITKLPSDDVSTIPAAEINDWHTYGFEWTPSEVRFFVDDVFQHAADYPASVYEHDEINVWLTAISTNNQSSDQELSEARYDYFRYYKPGAFVVGDGEELQIGLAQDLAAPVGGALTTSGFGSSVPAVPGIQPDVVVESGGLTYGAGTLHGNLTAEAGARIRVGDELTFGSITSITTMEDFEQFAPGPAYESGASTGLLPEWTFYDLGSNATDVMFAVSGADGTPSQPADESLSGESQMLFQTNPNIDFATESIGSEPFAGAVAVSTNFDTSGTVDVIDADFVFDGYGDDSGQFLDAKIVFGYRDIDNWYSLSLVAGAADGSATQVDVIANVAGERRNVFAARGTADFSGSFPQDQLLHANIVHDAPTGFVSFSITDAGTGEVLAEAYTIDEQFEQDGDVGLAVNNDAVGIDNLTVTTSDALELGTVQTLSVNGDYVQQEGASLEIDLVSPELFDQLEVAGSATLGGSIEIRVADPLDAQIGDFFRVISAMGGIFFAFDEVVLPTLPDQRALRLLYGETLVGVEVVRAGDFWTNGVVDGEDLLHWQRGESFNLGSPADLMSWQANYGAASSSSVSPAPEPATFVLLLPYLLLAASHRDARRGR